MFETYRKLAELLSRKERRRLYLLYAMMIVSALVEMFTIAALFPFLAIVARPQMVETNEKLSAVYHGLGFATTNGFLIFAGAVVFAVVFFGLLFATATQYAIYRFTAMRGYTIGGRVLRGYLARPYSWFLDQHSADLGAAVLTEVNEVVQRNMLPAMKLVAQAAVALLLIVLLVVVDPVAAFSAAAVLGGCYGAIYGLIRARLARMGQQRRRANKDKYKAAGEAIGGIKDVKLLHLEEAFLKRYERPALRAAEANAAIGVASETPRNVLRAIALGGILFFVLVMLTREGVDMAAMLPVLGLYAFAGIRLLPALQQIYASIASMRFTKPVLDKLHADVTRSLVDAAPAPAADVPAIPLRARLELREAGYAYPNAERAALDGLTLAIPARETVGVVGGTGAGKTTAVDVILGLLRPQSGALVVDGVEVTDETVPGWQKSVGYVPQHIFLTDESVAANIAFGVDRRKIDMEAVERAARIAELHDFVRRELPQGYDTMLGERGIRLSGGQRQRVGIARALYHDPDVLVLDEATSALDNLTERAVMDAVHNLGGKKTIIMIAHRLTTVQDCDRIFLLERGRVVAEGNYDQLVETSDDFRRMVSGGRG
ncbi:ABC transporter ATP-binding protein [Amaricoccus sp.]|uniref:ABC transporter ATP-binding protein n=1 Tax=Amaricoccus sp. TaxID=1872485 RepID=UPI001B78968C|nr:ABC transporter ATP-binding protein [Amaricoccus sp.]MBP7003002.1 ABC transporter ATP-binding protein [Amaricoccus sp.]